MSQITKQAVYEASLEVGNILETGIEVDANRDKKISIPEVLTAALVVVGKVNEKADDIRLTAVNLFRSDDLRNEFVRGLSDGLDLENNRPLENAIEKSVVAFDAVADAVDAWRKIGTAVPPITE